MVEPMGLEPTTFSLQGNCAPNCATAPCQTAVLQSGRSDTSMCYTFPFEVTAHRELLCRTLHSYSTAGCEFSLTRYPQRLSSLLSGRAIWPRKPRWSSHGDSNSDFHLERVASQPVRGWDDKAGFYLSLLGSCDFNRHSRPWECPNPPGGPVLWVANPQSNSSFQLQSQPSKLLYTIRDQRFNGESKLRSILSFVTQQAQHQH